MTMKPSTTLVPPLSAREAWLTTYWKLTGFDKVSWWVQCVLYVSVLQVAVVHGMWGFFLLSGYSEAGWVMAVKKMSNIWAGGSHYVLGWELMAAALMAVVVLVSKTAKKYSSIVLIPQQILVITALLAAAQSLQTREFADRTDVPRLFILSNQWPVIQMLCLHTVSYCVDSFYGLVSMVRDARNYNHKDRSDVV